MIHFQENLKNKNAFYKRIITVQNKYKMRHGVIYEVIHSSQWQIFQVALHNIPYLPK